MQTIELYYNHIDAKPTTETISCIDLEVEFTTIPE